MRSRDGGRRYEIYAEKFPRMELFITEYSNPIEGPVPEQYLEWLRTVKESGLVEATFSFIQSSHDPAWAKEAWRDEAGNFKEIVRAIGERDF
jgi:hypothetical protein